MTLFIVTTYCLFYAIPVAGVAGTLDVLKRWFPPLIKHKVTILVKILVWIASIMLAIAIVGIIVIAYQNGFKIR